MSRGRHTFRQSDVERAIKAARAAGETEFRVIVDGRLEIVVGSAPAKPAPEEAADRWLKKHASAPEGHC